MKAELKVALLAALTTAAASTHAIPLSTLIANPNIAISAGNEVFDHFDWSSSWMDDHMNGAADLIPTVSIDVRPVGDGIRLSFNGSFVNTDGYLDGLLHYSVHTVNNTPIRIVSNTVTVTDNSMAAVDETISGSPDASVAPELELSVDSITGLSASALLPNPLPELWITKDIMLAGPGEIVQIDQRFSTPEAGVTAALLGFGLVVLELLRRAHHSRRA